MNLQQLKDEAAGLPAEPRRDLIAHLVAIGRKNNGAFWEKVEAQIADRDAANWIGEDRLEEALRLNEPGA